MDELHLCESCAHDYLTNAQNQQSSEQPEGLTGKIKAITGQRELEELDKLTCPNCGISFREFRNQGRLGCPHDYIAFRDELLPLLDNIHGDTQHVGKVPRRAPDSSQRQYRLIKLRSSLRNAVEAEDYEEAARLRDEIQSVELEFQTEKSNPD